MRMMACSISTVKAIAHRVCKFAQSPRVVERFFRVDEGRAREVGGTGLGLAMVKHLALATGARLAMRSEPGEGSTFSVFLPRAELASSDLVPDPGAEA